MFESDRVTDLLERWHELRERGQSISIRELCADSPELTDEVSSAIEKLGRLEQIRGADEPREVEPPTIPGYEFIDVVAHGGQAVVFKARHLNLKRHVAIKMILSGRYASETELQRFRREAETLASFKHPNIVPIHEIGECDGHPFLALEFVDGGTLADKLNGVPQSPAQAAQTISVLARAIALAHANNIVHRDLKPGNILLAIDGTPKITDFGLAKNLEQEQGLSATGHVVGTPSYMAPEQARSNEPFGPAADIYALGAVLYEMLTGRPPFRGATSLDTLDQLLHQEPVLPRRLQPKTPRDLEVICLKCLEKESAKRYASAADLADDLDRWRAGRPILARPAGSIEKAWRWARRNPWPAGLAAAIAVLLVSATTITSLLSWRLSIKRNEAETSAQAARDYAIEANTNELAARDAQIKAEAEKRRARREELKARAVTEFMGGLFEATDPLQVSGATALVPRLRGDRLNAREMLRRGAAELETRELDPAIRAELQFRIGNSLLALGEHKEARPLLEKALAAKRIDPGPDHLETADVHHALAWLDQMRGDFEPALASYRMAEAIQSRTDISEPNNLLKWTVTRLKMAILLAEMGLQDEADRESQEATRLRRELAERDRTYRRHLMEALVASAVVQLFPGESRSHRVIALGGEALKILNEEKIDDRMARAAQMFQLGMFASKSNQHAMAEKCLTECVTLLRDSLGREHVYTGLAVGLKASMHARAGHVNLAEQSFEECLAINREQGVMTHPRFGLFLGEFVAFFRKIGKEERSTRAIDEWLERHKEDNPQSPRYADALALAGKWYAERDDQRALNYFTQAERIYRDRPKRRLRSSDAGYLNDLAACLIRTGDITAGTAKYREALSLWDDLKIEATDQGYVQTLAGLATCGKQPADLRTRIEAVRRSLSLTSTTADLNKRFMIERAMIVLHRAEGDLPAAMSCAANALDAAGTGTRAFEVACEIARCAASSGSADAESIWQKAFAALELAIKKGYRNAAALQTSAAFIPVRDRPEFKRAIASIRSASKKD